MISRLIQYFIKDEAVLDDFVVLLAALPDTH